MGKVISLNDFKKCENNKMIIKNTKENITITKDEMVEFEKELFFDDDDFISNFYLKEM